MITLDEIYKKDIAQKGTFDKILKKDLQENSKKVAELIKNSENSKEEWLKCPYTKDLCSKAECAMWIVTYQRCCFVSIAKALDIMTSIMDDRLGNVKT